MRWFLLYDVYIGKVQFISLKFVVEADESVYIMKSLLSLEDRLILYIIEPELSVGTFHC